MPAESGSAPRGTCTIASAGVARTIMWDSWPTIGSSCGPASSHDDPGAHVVVPLWPRPDLPGEDAGAKRRRRVGMALQREQRRADEEEAADERRDRVAGKPEGEGGAAGAEGEGLARAHGHTPEHLLDAEAREHTSDEIVRPHRDATRGDDDVGLERAGERLLESLLRVLDHRQPLDDRARRLQGGREHDPVRLVDLARLERLAGRPQLGAGDNDRRRVGRLCAATPRSHRPRARRAAPPSAPHPAEQHIAGADVLARLPDVVSEGNGVRDLDLAVRTTTTRSTGTTASAPSGTTPPVEMSIASPTPRRRVSGLPAATMPTMRSRAGVSAALTA